MIISTGMYRIGIAYAGCPMFSEQEANKRGSIQPARSAITALDLKRLQLDNVAFRCLVS